jgi:hypothetical protein
MSSCHHGAEVHPALRTTRRPGRHPRAPRLHAGDTAGSRRAGEGRPPLRQPARTDLLSDGLPQTFDGGTAAASFTSALPVTLDVQIGRQGFWSRPLALQPAVIDGDALVEGQTIELTLDPTLLQQALDELARR